MFEEIYASAMQTSVYLFLSFLALIMVTGVAWARKGR
jgi:hypothetical protein